MYKPKRWVELQVWLEVFRESKLNFHGVSASVVENNLLTVELLIHKHVQVVLLVLYVDGHVDTCSVYCDRDWLCVILVLEEECKPLRHFRQLHWDESELDLCATVTVNFSRALETNLRQKLLKNVRLSRLV